MKLNTFQELTTRIIHLSTRDGKPISISFSGQTAYTTTKTVNIPTLPSGTILTPNQFAIWLGYVIHEGPGHQTHSDLDLYALVCEQRKNPQFSYILNLLEDIRIENADIALYPGDRKYLDSVHTFVDQQIPPELAKSPDLMGLIYKQLYVHHRNLDTRIIHGNLDAQTSQLISEIDLCSSTQDCIHLADKIVTYLQQKKENSNGNDAKNNGANNSNIVHNNSISDADIGAETSNILDNKEEKNEKNAENNGNANNPKPRKPNPNGSGSGLGNDSGNENSSRIFDPQNGIGNDGNDKGQNQSEIWNKITEVKNIVETLKDQFENLTQDEPDKDLRGKSIFPPANILNDRIYVPSQEDLSTYTYTRNSCSSQILALKKMFRIYLQAQTQKSTLRGLEDGKLDHHRLHVVSTGSNLIFKSQSSKLLPETAIELMIDMSGSMNAEIARTSAIILSEALNSIPEIKLSISGFTTNHHGPRHDYYKNISPNSGRQRGMDILQFKNFSEPYAKAKAKLGAITNSGNTPLGDAYGKSLEHIILRPETRKIIFLITDGHPEFPQGKNHSDFLLMSKIHASCKKYKIQTLGLGIGRNLDFLKNYFDKAINITETADLPKNLLEALKSFI